MIHNDYINIYIYDSVMNIYTYMHTHTHICIYQNHLSLQQFLSPWLFEQKLANRYGNPRSLSTSGSRENFQFGQVLYFAYINRSLQSSNAIVPLLASFLCHVKSFKCAPYQIAKTIRPKICAKKPKICAKNRKKPKIQKVYRKLLVIAFSPWAQCVGIMSLDWFAARRE